jgi:hypothetical protein
MALSMIISPRLLGPHVVDTQQSSIIKWLEEALPPDKSYDA